MPRVINLVGKLLSGDDTPCVYSYAIEDPSYMLIDMMLHHAEVNMHVLTINNNTRFGHNFKVELPDPKLQVSVVILMRKAITDAFEANDSTQYIDIDNIVKAVVEDANKSEETNQEAASN
jgi:hypothetical protein